MVRSRVAARVVGALSFVALLAGTGLVAAEGSPTACEDGRVRSAATQARCCWPDQKWSDQFGRCSGAPACPPGWTAHGDDCVRAAPPPPQAPTPPPGSGTCTTDDDCGVARHCSGGTCATASLSSACGLAGKIDPNIIPGSAVDDVTNLLKRIATAVHISNLPQITSGNVPNAAAAIFGRQRVIVYSPAFLAQLRAAAGGTKWAVTFVLAHELGHHIEGHTITGAGSNHQSEFEADAWATHALKNMGASLEETTAAMRAMPTPASGPHPSSEARVRNITRAYNNNTTPAPGDRTPPPDPGPEGSPVPGPGGTPLPAPVGLARGTQIEPCSCRWAPGFRGQAPACASRVGLAVSCPLLWCAPMAPMTAVFCE